MPAMLDALGIAHSRVESAERAAETIQTAAATAFGTRSLHAVLLPRGLTSSQRSDRGSDVVVRPR